VERNNKEGRKKKRILEEDNAFLDASQKRVNGG
jgi:hypothetical protein